jgi:hypothetical protein
MTPSHSSRMAARKDGTATRRRYRYYQTRADAEGGIAWRVTASDIDPLVLGRLAAFLEDQQAIIAMVQDRDAASINSMLPSALGMAAQLRAATVGECRHIMEAIVSRIDLAHDNIAIRINCIGLRAQLGLPEPLVAAAGRRGSRCTKAGDGTSGQSHRHHRSGPRPLQDPPHEARWVIVPCARHRNCHHRGPSANDAHRKAAFFNRAAALLERTTRRARVLSSDIHCSHQKARLRPGLIFAVLALRFARL